jgi:PAS domain S-box-containing protein
VIKKKKKGLAMFNSLPDILLHILLVEDDEDDWRLIDGLLSEILPRKYRLEWVQTFSDALALIEKSRFDVYLLDYRLGERSGLELLEELQQRDITAPVLIISGKGDYAVDVAAMKAGAADYLTKDQIDAALLERSLRYSLERKRVEKQIVRAKREWESTFDAMADPVAIIDTECRFLRVNKAMAQRFGAAPKELVHDLYHEWLYKTSSPPSHCPHVLTIQDGREHSAEIKDKELGESFLITASPYYDHELHLSGCIFSLRDITELKRTEEALRQFNDQLEQRVMERTNELHSKAQALQEANAALTEMLRQREEDKRVLENSLSSNQKLIEELRQSESELIRHKDRLEYLNSRLIETNKAFTTLAGNIDLERKSVEKQIASKIRSIVLPVLNTLVNDKNMLHYGEQLRLMKMVLEDLTSDFSPEAKLILNLSPTELQIVALVKSGLSTEQIAERMCISSSTVKTHRKNIRRKLKIGRSHSLKNLLCAMDR